MEQVGELKTLTWTLESDGVCIVRLNRPEQRNAFTLLMSVEFQQLFGALDRDNNVKAVILGANRRSSMFCAGADLNAANDVTLSEAEQKRDAGGRCSLAIWRCRKPVIMAMHGNAIGIGITMALPADIRIVNKDAKIGFVFARRGLVAEAASTYFLPRLVGMSRALEWTLTGRIFRAGDQDSRESGLFNHVVETPDDVMPKALSIAREIVSKNSLVATSVCKSLYWRGQAIPTPYEAHAEESRALRFLMNSPEVQEGFMSFLEKRQPDFPGSPGNKEDVPPGFHDFPYPNNFPSIAARL
mmetsp:Transcript_17887/g.50386  ORF Transcript_17887/g.50386 Transcript_17887/m.50386 type:complete len:299 (+) Transcript_17887:121-1017(+)